MNTIYEAAAAALSGFAAKALGRPLTVKPSRAAMLAAPDFVRGGAEEAAALWTARLSECRLYDAPLLQRIDVKNGWLLLTLTKDVFDAYAQSLPNIAPGEAIRSDGAAYVDYRMDRLLRYGDAPLPDCEPVLRAILLASAASAKKRWTQDDERAVLTMTHALPARERIEVEHRCARAAKIILTERRTMR
ncbi:MAG: hypothetical protein IKI59_08220 [Clostridia bacterium]|nr:hypothetical protein [Clostridia bacterium]